MLGHGLKLPRSARLSLLAAAFALAALAGCGMGGGAPKGGTRQTNFDNSFVAAKVNGRPIYVEDVRTYAVANGMLPDNQELDATSDIYHLALHDLITQKLFALEAESRGLDREAQVRRELEKGREQILANAVLRELDEKANDPATIERLYRENTKQLGETQEIQWRQIQLATREAAQNAKRRLEEGGAENTFERLAFELSRDRATASEGGEMGWSSIEDLPDGIRQAAESARLATTAGPVQSPVGWHLIQVLDRRRRGVPSLAALRSRIIDWLRFEETNRLRARLESTARIELATDPNTGVAPTAEADAPADSPPPREPDQGRPQDRQKARAAEPSPRQVEIASEPQIAAPPVRQEPAVVGAPPPRPSTASVAQPAPRASRNRPDFPFPMGPGGIAGGGLPPPDERSK
ncbi:MAG: peptidylprolyl isomerase [Hyphomonadaceae bacterium]|nr:peptidylprolyl isomerase [Hyphomonadaceae bacterium]